MSVVDEINRIQDAKSSFVEGLTNLGVEVPEGELINNVVKTVNEDIFPLIDMRYNFSMTIDSIDADIGDPLVCIIWTPVEFTGELTVDIDGWYHGTVVPNHGKVHVRVPTVNTDTGECLSAGLHTVVAQFNGDTQYKPGIVTAIVRINKVDCNIEITDTSIDDGMLIANVTTERDAGAYSPCLIDAFECGWNTEGVLLVCEGSVLTYGNPTDGRAQFYAPLVPGTYHIQAIFLGDDKYNPSISDSVTITIPQQTPHWSIYAAPVNYPESLHFHIVGPQDATGDVGVMVGGLMYEGTLNDGECVIEVTNPDAGNYLAELYYEDTCVTYIEDVEVRKSTPRMTVEAEDTLFPNKAVVYVGLNMNESVGCTGDVHFNLNDTEYSAELNNSMARIDIPGIQVGNYQCTCYYDGDDNWNGTEGLIKFTVNPRE